jgi:hypothetical protein
VHSYLPKVKIQSGVCRGIRSVLLVSEKLGSLVKKCWQTAWFPSITFLYTALERERCILRRVFRLWSCLKSHFTCIDEATSQVMTCVDLTWTLGKLVS